MSATGAEPWPSSAINDMYYTQTDRQTDRRVFHKDSNSFQQVCQVVIVGYN